MPQSIEKLGKFLPASIMAVLIVYCLRDVGDSFMCRGLEKVLAVAIVAVVYKFPVPERYVGKNARTMLSIVIGTAAYMAFIHM